ncbi:PLD phosphodiesterase domain-containing protein [Pseudomonas sp. IT-196MI5]
MKLLEAFKQQLGEMDELHRVWLTTFNLNLGFVESQLLPAVLNMDPPRNRLDFEGYQAHLVEKGIDFRVFCDKRLLGADQYKRTAIKVHCVSARAFSAYRGMTSETLFHPKLILLESKKGKMVLGAGSANLTIGGWGRNQEVFTFQRVCNNDQYRQIKTFFNALAGPLELEFEWPGRRFEANDSDWQFVHSFDKYTFLQHLMTQGTITALQVWSPYLAADVPDLLARLQAQSGNPDLQVALVADRLEGRYFRTPWSEALAGCIKADALAFHRNPSSPHLLTEITHAKAWLCRSSQGSRLAIGSWNFTHAGTSSFEQRNIEAGIMLNCKRNADMLGACIEVTEADFASAQLLSKDCLEVPEELPFDLQVLYDWKRARFSVSGNWCVGKPCDDYWLKLPGVSKPMPLLWRTRRQQGRLLLIPIECVTPDNEAMLADHSYSILLRKKSPAVFRGMIVESGQSFRRAQGFESLKDLLDSLVAGVDPNSDTTTVLRPCLRNGGEPDEKLTVPSLVIEQDALSYFRLFQAIEQYRERLRATTDSAQLELWAFGYPGCLQELAAKARQQIKDSSPSVFNWFLAQEVNSLHKLAADFYRKFGHRTPRDELWSTLRVLTPRLPKTLQKRLAYIRRVQKECGYV